MDQVLSITKALADGNRLRIIMALTCHDELCVCQVTEMLHLAMPTVSRHMSVLQNAGLVKSRKDSRWVYYRISEAFPSQCLNWLKDALIDSEDIAGDKKRMETILTCDLEELCRTQKQRRMCSAS
ncbi:MAG: winged helix-turn-helix transcriptional regulator [Deltaproteobacteria bacterium]|nr:winged helix-turn-helix transcriptional regulator [Deltaproteobacteria bacterium]